MATDDMRPKERWLAAARLEPVDRLMFYPKLDAAYAPNQEAPFSGMSRAELFDWIGADRHEFVAAPLVEKQDRCEYSTQRSNGTEVRTYRTPSKTLEDRWIYDPGSCSWHPVEYAIKTPEDIAVMTELCLDCRVELDGEVLERGRERYASIGDRAVVATNIGTTPLMHVVQHLAGVENTHFFLMSHPDEMRALLDAMFAVLRRRAEIIADSHVADIYYLVENTSTTLISPDQYRNLCKPHVAEVARIMSDADCISTLHMCGHLKALLPDLAEVGVRIFEAFTSPPVGNTRLADGRTGCPDVCLFGGTNAALWLEPAEKIIGEIEADLAVLPHERGVILSSAGVMPPACRPETIREVCRWIQAHAVRD